MKMPLKVIFRGEEGIDEGGVTKEYFQLLATQLFDPRFGMFQYCGDDGREIWINKDCCWSFDEFRFIGVLVGLAVYNGVILNVNFPKTLYKKLLPRKNQRLTLQDLRFVDPGDFLLIYICNFHVLNPFLLIYTCKLHWMMSTQSCFTDYSNC